LIPVINTNAKWVQNGVTVAGGNAHGNGVNQLYQPLGVYVDDDQTIVVADYANHRIVEWKKGATIGQVVAGGKGAGNRNDQLNSPANVIVDRKNDSLIIFDYNNGRVVRWPRRNGTSGEIIILNVAGYGSSMDNDGYFYVSDHQRHEVRRWKIGETNGTLVAGGNGVGNRFDQLNQPYNIFVDQDQSVYVSDYVNHRVIKWIQGAKEGIVVAGGQGPGNSLKQLYNPRGVVVDQLSTVYVADMSNHRVMRWLKGETEGSVVVGGNGHGAQANQFHNPIGLSVDRQNNLYVVDQGNQRIQKFNIEVNSSS
jgi:sugar lactone lactonase YvrE